ncbi:MAG: SNF2-related protein [Bifidobacteriaceae bacterium]|nr:SNF2-related protein [Bifidobacteriaceae bacterium]
MSISDLATLMTVREQVDSTATESALLAAIKAYSTSEDFRDGTFLAMASGGVHATGIDLGEVNDTGGRAFRLHGEAQLDTDHKNKKWTPIGVTFTPCIDGSLELSDACCECPVGEMYQAGMWMDASGHTHALGKGSHGGDTARGKGSRASANDFGAFDDFSDLDDFGDLDDQIDIDDFNPDDEPGTSYGAKGGQLSNVVDAISEAWESASGTRGVNATHGTAIGNGATTALCAHVVALCTLFLITPQVFWGGDVQWGIHDDQDAAGTGKGSGKGASKSKRAAKAAAPERHTSPGLRRAMSEENMRNTTVRRQSRHGALESLHKLLDVKGNVNDVDELGKNGKKGKAKAKKSKEPDQVIPTPGSVHLEPHLEHTLDGWSLTMRIWYRDISYAIQDFNKLVKNFLQRRYDAYGKKLSFVHDLDLLDPYSRQIFEYLQRLRDTRSTLIDYGYGYGYSYYPSEDYVPQFGRKLRLSETEVCELLDLHTPVAQTEVPAPWRYAASFLVNGSNPLQMARTHHAANLERMEAQVAAAQAPHDALDPHAAQGMGNAQSPDGAAAADGPATAVDAAASPATVDRTTFRATGSYAASVPPAFARHSILFRNDDGGYGMQKYYQLAATPILEGDPAVFLTVMAVMPDGEREVPQTGERYSQEDFTGILGVRFVPKTVIKTFLHGARHSYAVVESLQTAEMLGIFCCSPEFIAASEALDQLCGTLHDQYVETADWSMFEDSIVPQLESAGVRLTLPRVERAESTRMLDPDLAFYLDRDEKGVSCELVAQYPDTSVQLIPRDHTVHARVDSDSTRSALYRSTAEENVGIELVNMLFPQVDKQSGLARIPEKDENSLLFLMRHGLETLRQAGTIYATDAFNALEPRQMGHIRFGVSIKSHLLEVTPLADEIPADEVAGLLASYRKRRRYHRLRNGELIDLQGAGTGEELEKFADAADALGISDADLANGEVTLPASRAFVAQSLNDEVDEDESFRAYVHDMDVIDPSRYQVPQGLNATMRPYQLDGFRWLSTLYDKDFGGILADEMGLGKTVQTIALLLGRRTDGTALVVCPASLVYNWESECKKFAPDLHVEVAAGTKAQRRALVSMLPDADGDGAAADGAADAADTDDAKQSSKASSGKASAKQPPELIITSYDLLRRDVEDYATKMFSTVVLDEAQYIKNPDAQMTRAVKRLNAAHRFALTGTPIENRLSELWSIFDFLMPGLLRSYHWFRAHFETPIAQAMEDGRKDVPEALQLRAITQVFIKRRLKSQVLRDLPERLETTVKVQLEGAQRKLYAAQERRLRDMLNGDPDESLSDMTISVLAELTRLREICCDPRLVYDDAPASSAKLDAIVDVVSSNIESDRRVLVFSQFTSFLDIIGKRLDKEGIDNVKLVGSTPKKRRIELANTFNAGEGAPVMLISLKAGNTGLNLIGASVVVHADPWWNAAAQDQATGRAHRIGQTHDVDVYQIIAADTVEERVHELQESKSRLAHAFTTVDHSAGEMSEADAKIADSGLFAGDEDAPAAPSIGRMTRGDILKLLS